MYVVKQNDEIKLSAWLKSKTNSLTNENNNSYFQYILSS